MTDRKKVLKGLECCSKSIDKACPKECPYRVKCLTQDNPLLMFSVMTDALELLKDEPLPVLNVGKYGIYFGDCPHCGKRVTKKNTSYCPYCGKRVKWE